MFYDKEDDKEANCEQLPQPLYTHTPCKVDNVAVGFQLT